MTGCAGEIRAVIASPIPGVPYLAVRLQHGELSGIDFLQQPQPLAEGTPSSEVEQVVACLQRYFRGENMPAPLLQPRGTPFQQHVWQLLQQIPSGETRSYGELATQLGSSARAVANACRANPFAILIPCHRVVAANGLGGYMGETEGEALAIKRWLLHHEGHV